MTVSVGLKRLDAVITCLANAEGPEGVSHPSSQLDQLLVLDIIQKNLWKVRLVQEESRGISSWNKILLKTQHKHTHDATLDEPSTDSATFQNNSSVSIFFRGCLSSRRLLDYLCHFDLD